MDNKTTNAPEIAAVAGRTDAVIEIRARYGMNARMSALIAKCCYNSDKDVCMYRKDRPDYRVSGKSVLGLLSLEATHGTHIVVSVEGEDGEARRIIMTIQGIVSDIREWD